jgi:phosphatidylserine/phosphatidylglycerophosphate/cardiolipin synthase-like enzyme
MDPRAGKPGSLHAKCIAVDNEQVFVSSANFTEAGQDRNIGSEREFGKVCILRGFLKNQEFGLGYG